jgi:hypothetical protein
MFYDIVIIVTPALLEKRPEYAGVDFVVLATAYAEAIANTICGVFQAMADDGSELAVRQRDIESTTDENKVVVGVIADD